MINLDTKFHFSMCDICGTETIGRPSKRKTDISKAIYHPFSKGDINIKHRVDLYHFNNSNAHKTDGQLINIFPVQSGTGMFNLFSILKHH